MSDPVRTDDELAAMAPLMPVVPEDAGHTVGEDLVPLDERPVADSPHNMPGAELVEQPEPGEQPDDEQPDDDEEDD